MREKIRRNAAVSGRWHDSRHTLITELSESGVPISRYFRRHNM
jgi:hypothetical protein